MTGHVIHVNTSINATPEAVWSVLTDLPHAADILRSVKSTHLVTEGDYDVGTTWRAQRTFFGHHGTEELHVTECDAPRRTLHEARLGHDTVRTAYTIQPGSDGTTRLLLTATLDVSDRTPGEKMMWNTLGGHSFGSTHKMLEQDLEDIRREAESRDGRLAGKHRAS
jgi:hypothetical protein